MGELIVELFRRSSTRDLRRLGDAGTTAHALREIWNTSIGSTEARLISEFMAEVGALLEGLEA